MKSLVAMILMTAVLLWVTPLMAADVAAGKELYGKKCASCHGVAGEGKESVAKTFKVELKHLGSKEIQTKSDADLKKVMLEGKEKMKGVKEVDAKGADDIVAFLRTLKK
jgi:mono/diheme cytochrome c family protein